ISGLSYENTRLRNIDDDEEWKFYGTNSLDAAYVTEGELLLEARAPGYESDEAVWDAFRAGEPVAIVDAFAFSDDEFGTDPDGWLAPKSADIVDGTIPAVEIEMLNAKTGQPETVTIIGVIDSKISTLFGLYIPEPYFNQLYNGPDFTALNVRLVNHESPDAEMIAKDMEAALLTRGVQAESIQELLDEQMSIQNGFLLLLQGFMGLGLVVGIAALGVISFRSVVERRQQIGMLRAIGYQKNMVALSFLLESLVIAAIGVLSGTILAVILSYNLVNSEDFQEGADFVGFVVPWGTIAAFVGASLVAAAIMTWVPARKASSVPIADALRYE
ncbi:MAG: ABC transporter permease, partial [Vicinamibacterales bacterium]